MVVKAPFAKCNKCPLRDNPFVPSEYHNSKILALAEAPGYHEVKDGKPLVGMAGQDMNVIIESAGGKRESCIYVNCCDCRPTKVENGRTLNRTPTDEEVACCNERLIAEIESLQPAIIIAMGKVAYTALGGKVYPGFKMGDVVGTEFIFRDKYRVLVTYHPAAISHSGGVTSERGKMTRDKIEEAFKKAFKAKPIERQLGMFDV